MNPHSSRNSAARFIARTGAAGSAVMLAVSAWAAWSPGFIDAAPTNAGSVEVREPDAGGPLLGSGSGVTPFTLSLPTGASCPGDGNAGWRVSSYMVPESIDPATLTFNNTGPAPQALGAAFRQPLYIVGSSEPYASMFTAAADVANGPGLIAEVPNFDFAAFSPGDIPPGAYNVGIACMLAGPTMPIDLYWNTRMVFEADADPVNSTGVKWTAGTATPPPTTVPPTTVPPTTVPPTTVPPTTVPPTTVPPTTVPPTTVPPTTVPPTTVPPTTVPPTTVPASVLANSTVPIGGSGVGSSATEHPNTGSSSGALAIWAALLGACGLLTRHLVRAAQTTPTRGAIE